MSDKFRNPRYINPEHTIIDMERNIKNYGWCPYTAMQKTIERDPELAEYLLDNAGSIADYQP